MNQIFCLNVCGLKENETKKLQNFKRPNFDDVLKSLCSFSSIN